ncbi:hypothetical protein [Neobacillus ginsengisoli]|nr:hypothetical protein [Neobacillus ginsengisoli]
MERIQQIIDKYKVISFEKIFEEDKDYDQRVNDATWDKKLNCLILN